MGSRPSTSKMSSVLPKRTASSTWFVKRGSADCIASSGLDASSAKCASSQVRDAFAGSMTNGTRPRPACVTTRAFSCDSESAGKPSCFQASSCDSVARSPVKENLCRPTSCAHALVVRSRTSSGCRGRYVRKPAARSSCRGSEASSARSSPAWCFQRACSPPSLPRSISALPRMPFACSMLRLSFSASPVRSPNSTLRPATRSSIVEISSSQSRRRCWHFSRDSSAFASSASRGWIFSRTTL
mmetsp:Transcript_17782/g.59976  ORF Transcript_17782/g.59976 Transcript_17782/m.59976 type:complete len:242 (+) Transcript_17782:799-1524(+)